MKTTTIALHTRFEIGPVDPRIFGGFLEHLGRAVYEGVYDPNSSHADKDGFRSDVLAALSRLKMPVMRYPGGNFASGYHWIDGVGSQDQRPTVRELAWQSAEPNRFGTDEFIRLCRRMEWAPMLTVNLGTGTPEEARNWVEYCNCPGGTRYADKRVANGYAEPHGVKLWCLGNEMDGPWQLGHVPAFEYALRAQQTAKMIRDVDPTTELVVCGSSNAGMSTYIEWDQQVLEHVGDFADHISLHQYVGNRDDDTGDYLAVTNAIDRHIEEIDATCRFVQAKRRSRKRAYLCFDEWNVWYKAMERDGEGKFAPHLIEEVYNLEDALVVAGFLNSFIRHADVVKIANIAQIVNVIAPILTRGDEMLVQSIFYPFEMYSGRRDGISIQPIVEGPAYEGKTNGRVHVVDCSAILNEDRLHVFLTNRSLDETARVRVGLADRHIVKVDSVEVLTGPHAKAFNSFKQPHVIMTQALTNVRIGDGEVTLLLPPLSVTASTFRLG
jgi:alpha-N-arabinofuranosidase